MKLNEDYNDFFKNNIIKYNNINISNNTSSKNKKVEFDISKSNIPTYKDKNKFTSSKELDLDNKQLEIYINSHNSSFNESKTIYIKAKKTTKQNNNSLYSNEQIKTNKFDIDINNKESLSTLILSNKTEVTIQLTSKTTYFDLYKGIIYMLISCLFKSFYSILIKYILNTNTKLTPFQLMAWRNYVMIWFVLFLGFYYKDKLNIHLIEKTALKLVIIRSILAVVSTPLIICSLKVLSISDVYSIFYIYPGLIVFFSMFNKQGKLGVLDYICLIACFVGVLLIVKPEFIFDYLNKSKSNIKQDNANTILHTNTVDIYNFNNIKKIYKSFPNEAIVNNISNNKTLFYILVTLSAFVKALEDICVKNAGNQIHFFLYAILYAFFGIIFFPIVVVFKDSELAFLSIHDWCLIILIASTSFGYICYMAKGLQNENAGRVSLVNYLQVVFMYISDILIFGKNPTIYDSLGTLLIFSMNTINGFYKAILRGEELNKYKYKNIDMKDEKSSNNENTNLLLKT